MKADAVTFADYGSPDVLQQTTIDVPDPGSGQVRIAVRASGVNRLDLKIRSGAMAAFMPVELPHIPGLEFAGTVEAIGADVHHLALGAAVFGQATHTYATHALADPYKLAIIPQSLDFHEAAALPVAAEAAWRALEELDVTAGQTLLVHGAAGGVGSLAVQFAISRGSRVIGTASVADLAYVTGLGGDAVTYGDGVADRVRALAPQGIDKVLDISGADVLGDSVRLTGNPSHVLTLADPVAAQAHGARFSPGGGPDDHTVDALEAVRQLHSKGALTQRIHAVMPLAEVVEAHRTAEAGRLNGKIVLAST
jgi:NADPH:quinone reductase-like Zn-dependent oxidoreductase